MSPRGLAPDSWFGGSLAASTSQVYSCGHRVGARAYSQRNMFMGKCFKLRRGENRHLSAMFDQASTIHIP